MKNKNSDNSDISKKYSFLNDQHGFSLIELIIVITIMAVLTGVVVPTFLSHLEESKIEADRDTLHTIYNSLMYQYALSAATPTSLIEDSFGGYSDTNHDIDINTKGEPILEIDAKGYASLTQTSNFQAGNFIYEALSSAGLDVDTLGSGGKIPLFHSKAMSKAVTTGGKHIMMTVDENDAVRVWVGSQSYNEGDHSSFSLPDARFAFGTMVYR